ncbi:YicC/YloC family endoribonuclease [Candidatus Pantoea carbekii]|uniref:YicC protein n=1 Tax=Candidatus Pantoea carbekii TaxID=1235990 RepID=U3U6T8_9GAMM|nr:YicC/YloC family endoribonuclease [Candidatus Pantoea carbekii]AKC32333.1 protein YicC [Candidatus Pantoea carbekii]BAO00052.1 YicC protein [Candidatus Pantoea carbekii]
MVSSMTSYALHEIKGIWGTATWELRSVNQRYLEISIRLPEQFRHLEPIIRDRIRNRLVRGKIECTLRFDTYPIARYQLKLNEPLANQLLEATKWLQMRSKDGIVNLLDILRWPDVMSAQKHNIDNINTELITTFDNVLTDYITARKNEGAELKILIKKRLETIRQEVKKIRKQMPEILKSQYERLCSKLEEVKMQLDTHRLEQEIVMLAQRIDLTEELDRIDIHVKETFKILEKKEAIGRRLDFIMQEFSRESNTLASKSNNVDVTSSAIEIKVLIEQMREQIQNIE